jgi:hypothetical protein
VSGSDALVDGCVGGIISKNRNNVRCSASESKTGQPSVLRRCTRTAIRWPLLSIDRIGLSSVSRRDAPLLKIDDLSEETEPSAIPIDGPDVAVRVAQQVNQVCLVEPKLHSM